MLPKKVTSYFLRKYILAFNKSNVIQLEKFKGRIKKILIISNTALGDTIMSTPAIRSLKMSFPESKISCIFHKNYIPLFTNMETIDEIIPYYGGYKNFIKTIKTIRNESFEACLILHGNSPQDIELALLSGAHIILKSKPNKNSAKYLSYVPDRLPTHAIRKRVFLIKLLGGKRITERMEIGKLHNKFHLKNAEKAINKRNEVVIGFQLGASHWSRTWPPEYFAKLTELIDQNLEKFKIILLGNKQERRFANIFFENIHKHLKGNITDLTGRLSIEELPYYFKQLDLLVTPDTGPLHLAIALKIPTVSLFALSRPEDTGPIQDLDIHKVIFKPEGLKYLKKKRKKNTNEAMKLIAPEEVMCAIGEIIENKKILCV